MKKIIIFSLFLCIICFAADSLNVRMAGRYTATSPLEVVIEGNKAYVANSSGGIQILDISDPRDISELGYFYFTGEAYSITLFRDDLVALASSVNAVRFVNIGNPSSIFVVGSFMSDGQPSYCISREDTIYSNGDNFIIIDASDPVSPIQIGIYEDLFDAARFQVSPPWAYLAQNNFGLSVMDISDPTSPVEYFHCLALTNYVRSVDVTNFGHILVGTDDELLIYRHCTDSIEMIASWSAPGPVHDIFIDGIYAFLACGTAGLRIIDISDPFSPSEVGYYSLGSECTDVYIDYPFAWVSGLSCRINAFNISGFAEIEETALSIPKKHDLHLSPNPFNSSCKVLLPCDAISLKIFDISGKQIETNNLDLKKSEFKWTPDENCQSGVYLISIETSNTIYNSKAIYLK